MKDVHSEIHCNTLHPFATDGEGTFLYETEHRTCVRGLMVCVPFVVFGDTTPRIPLDFRTTWSA